MDYRHVLVVPFHAESHVNSMLRFALLLAGSHHEQGLLISFGYPARPHGLALKRHKLSSLPPSLRVHVIEDGLPSAEHETPTIEQIRGSLAVMHSSIEEVLKQYVVPVGQALGDDERVDGVVGKRPASVMESSSWPPICCIISDTFLSGAQDVANKFDIPRVDFWTANATIYYMTVCLPEIIGKGILPVPEGACGKWKMEAPLIDFIPGLSAFHVAQLPMELLETSNVSDPRFKFLLEAFARAREADRILVNSVYELESHVYDAMRTNSFSIYPVGPLFDARLAESSTVSRSECVEWLDKQRPASVVYVAFGSIAKLSLHEMHSMALGLEASCHPFLWVIRIDTLLVNDLRQSLPEGFIEKTVSQGKGMIVTWAPQVQVLEHIAVGGFVTHCGWNSVLESLWEGVPMVGCPQAAEQRLNEKIVAEDWKVGVEMEREDDGSFTTEAVGKAIQDVMGNQEVKERALHFKKVIRHGHGASECNILSFVDHLLHLPSPSYRNPSL